MPSLCGKRAQPPTQSFDGRYDIHHTVNAKSGRASIKPRLSQAVRPRRTGRVGLRHSRSAGGSNRYMKLTSPAFAHNGTIPAKYTCDGANVNPPLVIADVPSEARTLVLIVDDPDVPKRLKADGVWDHWIVYNIPPLTNEVMEGEPPIGVLGLGSGGETEYRGPCPPDREHRYFFRLFAVDAELPLPAGATKHEVMKAIEGHILARAELIGRYGRKGEAAKRQG